MGNTVIGRMLSIAGTHSLSGKNANRNAGSGITYFCIAVALILSSPVASFAEGTVAANVVSAGWCITTTGTYCGLSSGIAACTKVSTPGVSGTISVIYSTPTEGICRHSNFPGFAGRVFLPPPVVTCPSNSTGTATCTCNTGFVPNSTGTSCVPKCPAHASGTPCVCDANYEFDAAGTSCISKQYTIALFGLGGEVMPTKTRDAYAAVSKSDGTAKSGAQVTLVYTLQAEHDGRPYSEHVGSISPNGGATGTDGRLNFVFTAPAAGATHTITATCTNGTNCTNQAKGTIKVPGCPVPDLTEVKKLSELYGETQEQADLTKSLESGMDGYSLLSDDTKKAEQCLKKRVTDALGATSGYELTSTIRTLAYQKHLSEVWDRFWKLKLKAAIDPTIQQRCQMLITQVEGEMGLRLTQNPTHEKDKCTAPGRAHCIRYEPATNDPKHAKNIAFDIPLTTVNTFARRLLRPPPSTVQKEANACNLTWGGKFGDPIHFQCCVK